MKRDLSLLLVIAVGLFISSAPVFAHHGQASYDPMKLVTVHGTVTEFRFANPHTQVSLDVKDQNGHVEHWVCEAMSPNMLTREGWDRHTLQPGEMITATGHPAKDHSTTMRLTKIVLANGETRDYL